MNTPSSPAHDNTCALVLAAHGSQTEPHAALAIHRHVASLRTMGLFSEVRASFWKEAPEWRIATTGLRSSRVIVVPMLMSQGYFAERVLPAQLDFARVLHTAPITQTLPVGTHPDLQLAAMRALDTQLDVLDVPRDDITLVIAGHGTSRHAQSKQSILDVVELARTRHPTLEVLALFLDEAPLLDTFQDVVHTSHAIVLPYFIASGQHTLTDIPEALGVRHCAQEKLHTQALTAGDITVHYLEPVGAQPGCVDVILSRAREGGWGGEALTRLPLPIHPPLLGVLRVSTHVDSWEVRHKQDRDAPPHTLHTITDPLELWWMVRHERADVRDAPGDYRALPYAVPMPAGWRFETPDPHTLQIALDLISPAHHEPSSSTSFLPPTLEETLGQARGLYKKILSLTPEARLNRTHTRCDTYCMACRKWGTNTEQIQTLEQEKPPLHLPCITPCATLLTELLSMVNDEDKET